MAACAQALALGEIDPQILLLINVGLTIPSWMRRHDPWVRDAVKALDNRLSSEWLRASRHSFQFSAPRETLPALQAIAQNPDGSLTHLAKLALSASAATGDAYPPHILAHLIKLSET